MSVRPGIRYIPRPSMRFASAGTGVLDDGPTAAMRPPRTTTVAFRSGRSLVMVRTVTLVIAKGAGSGPSVARNRAPPAAARSRAVKGAPAAGGFPTGLWLEECRCHSSRWNADSGLNLMLVPVVA